MGIADLLVDAGDDLQLTLHVDPLDPQTLEPTVLDLAADAERGKTGDTGSRLDRPLDCLGVPHLHDHRDILDIVLHLLPEDGIGT